MSDITMSAMSFARQAFGREKPRSSVTDWIEILTAANIAEEAYDGIPELVESINLQASGPAEASRALRKKLKHGNPHQQYRSLVLLKALVENCGHRFQTTFADGQLTDALKHISSDSNADKRVKKKLLLILGSWRDQFKSDPSMSLVAGLYKQCRGGRRLSQQELGHLVGLPGAEPDHKNEREEAKKAAKREKELARERERQEEAGRRSEGGRNRSRMLFNFEKDKPKVLASIVDASQASSNLVNAITLVNPETDSLQTNERVQECLARAKQARKTVVRYIQLVENEELIGTLIETNERIIAAMESYDQLLAAHVQTAREPSDIPDGLAEVHTNARAGEIDKLQQRQRFAVQKAKQQSFMGDADDMEGHHIHPDLQDLSFGPLGASSNNLPTPLRPSTRSDGEDILEEQPSYDNRGSLSDFSDYQSSDEETHNANGSSKRRDYVNVSDDPDDDTWSSPKVPLTPPPMTPLPIHSQMR
ncbi:hypothetical protein BD779DRAFT_1795515 [Infundibulicybe gibba]|nr:hypothetical protein BD779DRAFT_1795515 [Infundibulicybe gibba]